MKIEDNRNLNRKEPNLEKITIREPYSLNIHIPFICSLVKIRINEMKWIDPGWGGGFTTKRGRKGGGLSADQGGLQLGFTTVGRVTSLQRRGGELGRGESGEVLSSVTTARGSCPGVGVAMRRGRAE